MIEFIVVFVVLRFWHTFEVVDLGFHEGGRSLEEGAFVWQAVLAFFLIGDIIKLITVISNSFLMLSILASG